MMEGFPSFIKPKNIAKAVAGASLLLATSGEVAKVYAGEDAGKTSIEKIKRDNNTPEAAFFDTSTPNESGVNFTVETSKIPGSLDYNRNASEKVEINNVNKSESSVSGETNNNFKTDEQGNTITRSIGELR